MSHAEPFLLAAACIAAMMSLALLLLKPVALVLLILALFLLSMRTALLLLSMALRKLRTLRMFAILLKFAALAILRNAAFLIAGVRPSDIVVQRLFITRGLFPRPNR